MAKKKKLESEFKEVDDQIYFEKDPRFRNLYEALREAKALKFHGILNSTLYWKALNEDAKVILAYSHHHIEYLEFKVEEEQWMPKWDELEESGFLSVRIFDLKAKEVLSVYF